MGLSGILKGLTRTSSKTTREQAKNPNARVEQALGEMPFAEEMADAPTTPVAGQKISEKITKPAFAATPLHSPHSRGTVPLNSAKYMNGGETGFRKGGVNETHDYRPYCFAAIAFASGLMTFGTT